MLPVHRRGSEGEEKMQKVSDWQWKYCSVSGRYLISVTLVYISDGFWRHSGSHND